MVVEHLLIVNGVFSHDSFFDDVHQVRNFAQVLVVDLNSAPIIPYFDGEGGYDLSVTEIRDGVLDLHETHDELAKRLTILMMDAVDVRDSSRMPSGELKIGDKEVA